MKFFGVKLFYFCLLISGHTHTHTHTHTQSVIWFLLRKLTWRDKTDPGQVEQVCSPSACNDSELPRWRCPGTSRTRLRHQESDQDPQLEVQPMFTSVVLSLPLLTSRVVQWHQATLPHLCELAWTFSPSCWSCDSLPISQNPIWASLVPWALLTTHLKSTCFLNSTLIAWTTSFGNKSNSPTRLLALRDMDHVLALKLHLLGHFMLHHSISI